MSQKYPYAIPMAGFVSPPVHLHSHHPNLFPSYVTRINSGHLETGRFLDMNYDQWYDYPVTSNHAYQYTYTYPIPSYHELYVEVWYPNLLL